MNRLLLAATLMCLSPIVNATEFRCIHMFNGARNTNSPIEVFISGDAKTRETILHESEKHIGHYDFKYQVQEGIRNGQPATVLVMDGRRSDIESFVFGFIPEGEKQMNLKAYRDNLDQYMKNLAGRDSQIERAKVSIPEKKIAPVEEKIFVEFSISSGNGLRKDVMEFLKAAGKSFNVKVTETPAPRDWTNKLFRDGASQIRLEGTPEMIEQVAIRMSYINDTNVRDAFRQIEVSVRRK